jgi:hypothetical protein
MQLSVTKKSLASYACLLFLVSILFAACHRANLPTDSAVPVSLCELYQHPGAYDGKLIIVRATATRLPNGTYLYPGPSRECSYSFIKLVANDIQNGTLSELESTTAALPARKEFDLELTGTFDAKYSEPGDAFQFRIVPTEIKPQSPVRTAKPLGAA